MQGNQSGGLLDPRAYLFFPNPAEQKTEFTKKGTRFFYFGQILHDEYERKKLQQFHDYISANKIPYDKDSFTEQHLLLFLQSCGYKPKDTLQALGNYIDFRRTYLPIDLSLVESLLSRGLFYVCGRDRQFRPILVFNLLLFDVKNLEACTRTVCFVQELVIREMLLPGQVENWVAIYDLGGMGITDLPMGSLKATISLMSNNYGGRLFKMFSVNAPGTIWFAWKAVSAFLDAVTVEKIKISKTNSEESMFKNIDPTQVQVKYGGKQPNKMEYWPIKLPQAVVDDHRLITMEEYQSKYNRGELSRNNVHPLINKNNSVL